MSKNLLAKYYQENKKRLQQKARERYQNHSKDEKEWKQWQYGRELCKNLPGNENFLRKSSLSIEKNIIESEKIPYYNHEELSF